MATRYMKKRRVEPPRVISKSDFDIFDKVTLGQRVDDLAYKYYKDKTLSWVIMFANPEYFNEFNIPVGTEIRIPMPLSRAYNELGIEEET